MMRDLLFSAKPVLIPSTVERKKMGHKQARHPHSMVKFANRFTANSWHSHNVCKVSFCRSLKIVSVSQITTWFLLSTYLLLVKGQTGSNMDDVHWTVPGHFYLTVTSSLHHQLKQSNLKQSNSNLYKTQHMMVLFAVLDIKT